MTKPTDISDYKIKKVVTILEQLHKQYGQSVAQLHNELNDTLLHIGRKIIEYYESQYDEDEPGIAAHNTSVLMLELIGLAEGTMIVTERD